MGRKKTDDTSSISGNSCKTEAKCREDDAFSSLTETSTPSKSPSDGVELAKKETFDTPSAEIKGTGRSPRIRENSRSIMRNKTKAEIEQGVCTTKVKTEKETVLSIGSVVGSKSEVASSKRQISGDSWRGSWDDGKLTSKRLKAISLPAVHIQRLSSTEPVLYSFSANNKRRNAERKPATTATDLSEGQLKNCGELLMDSTDFDEISVKDEPTDSNSASVVDKRSPEAFKVKLENGSDDSCSGLVQDVADAERKNENASGMVVLPLTKSGNDLKAALQPTDRPRSKCGNEGLTENEQSSNAITKSEVARDDSTCNDVVVLSVVNSRSRSARRSRTARNDASRKRSGTTDDQSTYSETTMPIKQEPCSAADLSSQSQESGEADERAFVQGTPNKVARTTNKNAEAKTAKKAKSAAKSKQHSGTGVSLSVLTRSMIKVPG